MSDVQKIVPNLWFDHTVKEAVDFYISVFPRSAIHATAYYPKSEAEGLADFQRDLAGKELTIDFSLAGHNFTAINAGPEFTPTAANSFMVNFDPNHDAQARQHIDEVWDKLCDGGEILMALDTYPYSERYGWVKDKYGFSWQLILTNPAGDDRPCIIPSFLFSGSQQNKAKEAVDFYISVFRDSSISTIAYYNETNNIVTKDSIMFADFMLEGQWFSAMDSGVAQDFTFNEAISFAVFCNDQQEIDYYWKKLSAHPESEQCGWLKDQFGVSWQIVPHNMEELMQRPNAFAKLMQMKKIIIGEFNDD